MTRCCSKKNGKAQSDGAHIGSRHCEEISQTCKRKVWCVGSEKMYANECTVLCRKRREILNLKRKQIEFEAARKERLHSKAFIRRDIVRRLLGIVARMDDGLVPCPRKYILAPRMRITYE
jgi:hypothetical protein